jgi:hypothetical protein
VEKLGTVNGRVLSSAWCKGKRFDFDGTTRGLARAAILAGVEAGDRILANYGGREKQGARACEIVAAPHDDRAFGFWIEESSDAKNI